MSLIHRSILQRTASAALLTSVLIGCTPQDTGPGSQPTLISVAPTPLAARPTALPALPSAVRGAPTIVPTAALPTLVDGQPATDPLDAVGRFLRAAQADRSGRLAANYAGDGLRPMLQQGGGDIGAILQEQNPFSAFILEGVIDNPPPFVYVRVILSYGDPPQPRAVRMFTVKQEGDFWLVTGVAALEG
jgi:hypothetical protein